MLFSKMFFHIIGPLYPKSRKHAFDCQIVLYLGCVWGTPGASPLVLYWAQVGAYLSFGKCLMFPYCWGSQAGCPINVMPHPSSSCEVTIPLASVWDSLCPWDLGGASSLISQTGPVRSFWGLQCPEKKKKSWVGQQASFGEPHLQVTRGSSGNYDILCLSFHCPFCWDVMQSLYG